MLFQYGLLFFLFTTFAAAAPAGVPPAAAAPPTAEVPPTIQRRTLEDFAEYHGDFLMANHGVWTWDKTQNGPGKENIKWVVKRERDYSGYASVQYVIVNGAEYKVDDLRVGKGPSALLLGTWKRGGTDSKIRIWKQTLQSGFEIFDCTVLNEGKWHPEKEAGRTEHYETFKENIDFITAGNGVWVEKKKGDKIEFKQKRDEFSLVTLDSWYTPIDGKSVPFDSSVLITGGPVWGGHNPKLFGNWTREETHSEIEIIHKKESDDDWFAKTYFIMKEMGTWKRASEGNNAHLH